MTGDANIRNKAAACLSSVNGHNNYWLMNPHNHSNGVTDGPPRGSRNVLQNETLFKTLFGFDTLAI